MLVLCNEITTTLKSFDLGAKCLIDQERVSIYDGEIQLLEIILNTNGTFPKKRIINKIFTTGPDK